MAKKKASSKQKEKNQANDSKEPVDNKEKKVVKAIFIKDRIVTEASDEARDLFNQSRYGALLEENKIQLSLLESLYLLEKGKLEIIDGKNKIIPFEKFLRKAQRLEPNYWIRYCIFRDMRNRGYIIKTALKFGANFRVYDRGVKPGEDHAKWIVYPVQENSSLTWHEFSAKNRVAHSTKKRLLIGIVDEENDVTYYEIKWTRP
ncbi:MAG: tRNA-intron lyase [Candidatus Woesearchaeota archaeon]